MDDGRQTILRAAQRIKQTADPAQRQVDFLGMQAREALQRRLNGFSGRQNALSAYSVRAGVLSAAAGRFRRVRIRLPSTVRSS